MKIKEALRDHLLAQAPVTAVLGTRIHAQAAPQGQSRPYATFEIESTRPVHHMLAPTDLVRHTFLVRIFDNEDQRCWDAANAIREALDGFTGVVSGTTIDVAWFDGEQDDYFWETDAGNIGVYMALQTYTIWSRR